MDTEKLKIVMKQANAAFKKIKDKYNELSGYLVFSSAHGQCNLTIDISEILKMFPAMIDDSQQKEKSVELAQSIMLLEMDKKKSGEIKGNQSQKIEKAKSQLLQIVDNLDIKKDTYIEIRFNKANLDLIYKLQKDGLVSQKHTPQSKASIRIVLGTIGEMYENDRN